MVEMPEREKCSGEKVVLLKASFPVREAVRERRVPAHLHRESKRPVNQDYYSNFCRVIPNLSSGP